ncbi:hypothetical protein JVT61DRAFT_9721 [Boletus reticuloceps]|uniref:UBR-type domain-containing protein n=1 Tax=Boletus reticuloceps TaxID=495285 RepID=A0A8I3A5G7_9AGAM|nr:hypothetical protein JVT61DRAFT_9721 [Boletus reticuloceps]
MSSLNDLLASQDALLREAALALPHEFSRCTFDMGPIRQAVYLCLTCATLHGICSSCSIACHTDHEQVELFPKRHFRCDCPTSVIPHHPCTLHKTTEEANGTNQYGQNFRGLFCRCAKPYDSKTEQETMIQCLACEDWFHESCLNLRERPPPRESSPDLPDPGDTPAHEDDCSDASLDLPPPLISADDYDSFVCAACVSKVPTLRRYAGTTGVITVVRDVERGSWKRLEGDPSAESQGSFHEPSLDVADPEAATTKRPRSRSSSQNDEREAKRTRVSESPLCLAPAVNPIAQAIFDNKTSGSKDSTHEGIGDIFLTEGFRERWCRCERCLPSLQACPYLLEEEDTYEPPEDPDSGMIVSLLKSLVQELWSGCRATVPLMVFTPSMACGTSSCYISDISLTWDVVLIASDHLLECLRPFAQQGKIVEAADVTQFFEALKEKRRHVN